MVGLVSTATVTYAVVLNIADNATPADVVAQVHPSFGRDVKSGKCILRCTVNLKVGNS